MQVHLLTLPLNLKWLKLIPIYSVSPLPVLFLNTPHHKMGLFLHLFICLCSLLDQVLCEAKGCVLCVTSTDPASLL